MSEPVVWNPVDLSGRPKCFWGMHTNEACIETATRYLHDPEQSIFLFLCDQHARGLHGRGLPESLPIALAAPASAAPPTVWLVERARSGRPYWMAWRDRDRIEWVSDANLADRFDWEIAAAQCARDIARFQGIECRATEHMFVPAAAAPLAKEPE